MNVTDAVSSRISGRAFLDTPVPMQTLVEILEIAERAPINALRIERAALDEFAN